MLIQVHDPLDEEQLPSMDVGDSRDGTKVLLYVAKKGDEEYMEEDKGTKESKSHMIE